MALMLLLLVVLIQQNERVVLLIEHLKRLVIAISRPIQPVDNVHDMEVVQAIVVILDLDVEELAVFLILDLLDLQQTMQQ